MSVVVLLHRGRGNAVNGAGNGGGYLPPEFVPRIFIVEKPPDFS